MYSQFQDAAMKNARRSLDPVWDDRQSQFDQSMINKGFAPGSKGYTAAEDTLNRSRNDAYNDAAFGSMQFGANRMDADRAFGENRRQFDKTFGLGRDQFKEGQRQFNEGTRRYNQGFGEDQRRFDMGFGEGQRQFDEGTRRYDQGFGEDTRRYDEGFGEGQRRFDLGFGESQYQDRRDFGENRRRYDEGFDLNRMLELDNVSRAYNDQSYRDAVFNASREDQQLSALMQMMGMGPSGGAQPINMSSSFNNSLIGEIDSANRRDDQIGNYLDILGSVF